MNNPLFPCSGFEQSLAKIGKQIEYCRYNLTGIHSLSVGYYFLTNGKRDGLDLESVAKMQA